MPRPVDDAIRPSPLATSSPLVHGRAAAAGRQPDTGPPAGWRRAGVMLHVTSIPGPDGIGDLGAPARSFVDWLASSGQRLWQTLPLRPPAHPSPSPYDAASAFAGNPLLVNLDDLAAMGLLPDTIDAIRSSVGAGISPGGVDDHRGRRGGPIGRTARWKLPLVRQAARQLLSLPPGHELMREYLSFCTREAWWLADHVAFTALREQYPGVARRDWPTEDRVRQLGAHRVRSLDIGATHQHPEAAVQFLFDLQLRRLHEHAAGADVWLMTDTPMYVADDSADVWAHPDLFLLDAQHRPRVLTGAPPDELHPSGQVWPMPAYDWQASAATDHEWWVRRVGRELEHADLVRLGQFREVADWWSVPPRAAFGEQGHWEPGPGAPFVETLDRRLGETGRLVVEDLGASTPALEELRRAVDLPTVRVLARGFDEGGSSSHLPTAWHGTEAAYTATQDVGTVAGWADAAAIAAAVDDSDRRLEFALRVTGASEPAELPRAAIEAVMQSRARLAIVPLQDWLEVDTGAGAGMPGNRTGTWEWVAPAAAFSDTLAQELGSTVDRAARGAAR